VFNVRTDPKRHSGRGGYVETGYRRFGDRPVPIDRSTRMSLESSREGSTTLVSDVKLCLRLPATPFRGPDADPFVPVLSSSFPRGCVPGISP
jgi:hypothetical protein